MTIGPYLFGVCPDKAELPKGWRYIEAPGAWLLAEGPDGRQWFAGRRRLTLSKIATAEDCAAARGRSLRVGERFVISDTWLDISSISPELT